MTDETLNDKYDKRLNRIAWVGAIALASNVVVRALPIDSFSGNLTILLIFSLWFVMPVYGVITLALRLLRARSILQSKTFEWLYYGAVSWVALSFLMPALNAKQLAPIETLVGACEKETSRISLLDWHGSVCWDGWLSSSKGPGTCSHHGGIDYQATQEREEKFTRHEMVKRFTPEECQEKARSISWLE